MNHYNKNFNDLSNLIYNYPGDQRAFHGALTQATSAEGSLLSSSPYFAQVKNELAVSCGVQENQLSFFDWKSKYHMSVHSPGFLYIQDIVGNRADFDLNSLKLSKNPESRFSEMTTSMVVSALETKPYNIPGRGSSRNYEHGNQSYAITDCDYFWLVRYCGLLQAEQIKHGDTLVHEKNRESAVFYLENIAEKSVDTAQSLYLFADSMASTFDVSLQRKLSCNAIGLR